MTIESAGRAPAFRRLGTTFSDGTLNTQEMLRESGLANWNVEVMPANNVITEYATPDNMYFTVRQSDNRILGAVKSRYVPVQNESAFSWADGILDGGGQWDTAGAFKNGAVVFGSMIINEAEVVVDRGGLNDKVKMYLVVSNTHDGSRPLQTSITPIRVVCQNTLNMMLKDCAQTFKIKHTSSAEARAMLARDALNLTFRYSQQFNELANTMYQTKFDDIKFSQLIKDLFPKPDVVMGKDGKINKAPVTKWENTVELVHTLRTSHTNRDINGTAWGAFNILTERLDWFRQGENDEAKAQAASGFSGAVNNEKQRILEKVLDMSGIVVG